jgi:hypothetical protein
VRFANRRDMRARSTSFSPKWAAVTAWSPRFSRILRSNVVRSAFGGKPDVLCSFRAFPLLTRRRHVRRAITAAQTGRRDPSTARISLL